MFVLIPTTLSDETNLMLKCAIPLRAICQRDVRANSTHITGNWFEMFPEYFKLKQVVAERMKTDLILKDISIK